jgi:predicted nucleotidyltransferase
MIAVSPAEMEIILAIIKKHVPECDVLAFGSRFKGTHNDASDLDLAIVGNGTLRLSLLGSIKEDFMESDIPYKVDVLDYHSISPAFRSIVDSGHERIYHPS